MNLKEKIADYPCNSDEELRQEEQRYLDIFGNLCCNEVRAYRSEEYKKEYYEQKVSGELEYKMNYQTEEPALPWNPPVPPPSGSL